MFKVLITGNDGRTDTLAWKIWQSPLVNQVFALPGNAGTPRWAQNVALDPTDFTAVVRFARQHAIDLTVVSSEDLLAQGIGDAFLEAELLMFGPTRAASIFESSKIFTQGMMYTAGIRVPNYSWFDEYASARRYAFAQLAHGKEAVVIKAEDLAQGKGVFVCKTPDAVSNALHLLMKRRIFGTAGDRVLVQEYLQGFELSSHVLCDGKTLVMFPFSQDYKTLREQESDDQKDNPNTGGMGAYTPIPLAHLCRDELSLDRVRDSIVEPSYRAMEKLGRRYTGCMYHGLMVTADGVVPLEGNCRFGNPELLAYLIKMESDIVPFLMGCALGELEQCGELWWHPGAAVTITLACATYPYQSETGTVIEGIEDAEKIPGVHIFHGGTKEQDKKIVTNGGRVLHVSAYAEEETETDSIHEAARRAYQAASLIYWPGMQYRKYIGSHLPI